MRFGLPIGTWPAVSENPENQCGEVVGLPHRICLTPLPLYTGEGVGGWGFLTLHVPSTQAAQKLCRTPRRGTVSDESLTPFPGTLSSTHNSQKVSCMSNRRSAQDYEREAQAIENNSLFRAFARWMGGSCLGRIVVLIVLILLVVFAGGYFTLSQSGTNGGFLGGIFNSPPSTMGITIRQQ